MGSSRSSVPESQDAGTFLKHHTRRIGCVGDGGDMVVLYVWSRCILIYRVPSTFNEKDSITYRLVTISAVLNYPVFFREGEPGKLTSTVPRHSNPLLPPSCRFRRSSHGLSPILLIPFLDTRKRKPHDSNHSNKRENDRL